MFGPYVYLSIQGIFLALSASVADPDPEPERDPEGSETFGRIRIRFGTEINILDPDSDPDSNPDPKLDLKKVCKKEHDFQAAISWFHMIIHISHL